MVNSCGRPRTELTGGPAKPASASSGLRSSREPGQESFRRKPAPLAFMKISAGAAEPDSGCRRAGVPQGCASARFSQRNSDHRSDELWTLARLWPCAARQREPSPTRATASTAEWSSMTLAANSPRSAQLHSIYVFADQFSKRDHSCTGVSPSCTSSQPDSSWGNLHAVRTDDHGGGPIRCPRRRGIPLGGSDGKGGPDMDRGPD